MRRSGPHSLADLPGAAPARVASSGMADQSVSEEAREAVLKAIIKSAPSVGNSPAGIRDLAEAYALLERDLLPNAGVVHNKT
jgi:hypothetical protein